MNAFHEIDLKNWNRLSKFRYYRQFENQLFNITLQANAGALFRFARERRRSFFLMTLFAILKALNQVPEMRRRITEEERVIEFEHVAALTTIMTAGEEFTMALTEYADRFDEFLVRAAPAVEAAKQGKFDPEGRKRNDYICASCVPWYGFSALSQAALSLKQSIVILAWGKMNDDGMIPISLQLNHALVDGIHVGHFLKFTEENFSHPERL